MATVLRSPDGSPSDLRSPPGITSPRNNFPPTIVSPGAVNKPNARDYDVPFFTVAHYRSPVSPTTYEVPVLPHRSINNEKQITSLTGTTKPVRSPISSISPVQIAFGHLDMDNHGVVKDSSDSGSSCCQSSTGSWSSGDLSAGEFQKKKRDDTLTRGFCSVLFTPKPFQAKPVKSFTPQKSNFKCHTENERKNVSESTKLGTYSKYMKDCQNKYDKNSKIGQNTEHQPNTVKEIPPKIADMPDCKRTIYEDATVTLAGERIESQISSRPSSSSSDQTPRTPKFKSREPSFCLEFNSEPQDENEYLAVLHLRIAEAHERQLLPLKEDLADWISKLLDLTDITPDNLILKLDNGVILCHLAELISNQAQESKNKGNSTVEVPKLPYRVWPRARSGSFFARDNVTNFLRFCRRLGVHENLLFETEDLVCRTEVRGIVLCLLEVGRLATLWWAMEAPVLVKLEKEIDREDVSSRFDSHYCHSSIGRNSCSQTDDINRTTNINNITNERPMSAPVQFSVAGKNGRSAKRYSCVPPLSARGPKPVPPPKPATIKAALYTNSMRPTTFPAQRTYDRGWSGANTTPVTPAATPTYSSRTRLPVATTPRSSGRSTPNTTPTTPTNSRKYLSSLRKSTSPSVKSGIPRLTSFHSSSSLCSKQHNSVTSPTDIELNKMIQAELDNKVKFIAEGVHGVCNCSDANCLKAHVRRLADGKYDIHGRNVLVRLLKGKHVMVRVGGGWDTLEHYLLRHSRSEVKKLKAKTLTQSPPNYCARARPYSTDKTVPTCGNKPKRGHSSQEERMSSLIGANFSNIEDSTQEQSDSATKFIDIPEIGSCNLISAPVGECGDFQSPPLVGSNKDTMMVSSCPTLDIVDAEDTMELAAQEQCLPTQFDEES